VLSVSATAEMNSVGATFLTALPARSGNCPMKSVTVVPSTCFSLSSIRRKARGLMCLPAEIPDVLSHNVGLAVQHVDVAGQHLRLVFLTEQEFANWITANRIAGSIPTSFLDDRDSIQQLYS
jgi:hypothetical protein